MTITNELLDEIDRLEAAATSGPWTAINVVGATDLERAFILYVCNNASALTGEIRRLRNIVEVNDQRLADMHDSYTQRFKQLVDTTRDQWETMDAVKKERDEARASLDIAYSKGRADERDFSRIVEIVEERLTKERDAAKAALRMLWEEADSKCAIRDATEDAVKAVLGEE